MGERMPKGEKRNNNEDPHGTKRIDYLRRNGFKVQ